MHGYVDLRLVMYTLMHIVIHACMYHGFVCNGYVCIYIYRYERMCDGYGFRVNMQPQ